jgi:hypothetical protein
MKGRRVFIAERLHQLSRKVAFVCVVSRTVHVLFAERMSSGPPAYV